MQKRLAELEEKFQKDQEEKEKNAASNAGDSWKEKYDAERIKGKCHFPNLAQRLYINLLGSHGAGDCQSRN